MNISTEEGRTEIKKSAKTACTTFLGWEKRMSQRDPFGLRENIHSPQTSHFIPVLKLLSCDPTSRAAQLGRGRGVSAVLAPYGICSPGPPRQVLWVQLAETDHVGSGA